MTAKPRAKREKEVRLTLAQEQVFEDQMRELGMPRAQFRRALKAMVPGSAVVDRFEKKMPGIFCNFSPSQYSRDIYDSTSQRYAYGYWDKPQLSRAHTADPWSALKP